MFKKFSLIILCLLTANSAFSQTQDYPFTLCTNVGGSAVGIAIKKVYKLGSAVLDFDVHPAYQVTADLSVSKYISVGLAYSTQSFDGTVSNWKFNNDTEVENFNFNITRKNIAVRGLVHYGGLDRFDFYSGLRLGYTTYTGSTTSRDPDNKLEKDFASFFAPQLVLLGCRGYFTKYIGANVEFSFGSPHWVSAGLALRVPSFKKD